MRRPLAVLALAAALGATACGSERLSAEEYRDEVAQICERSEREAAEVEQPTRATPASIADFFRRQLAISERNLERFGELEPPEQLAGAHDRTIESTERVAAAVEEIIAELDEGGDPREVLSARRDELERLNRAQRDAAGDLGVPSCAD